MMLSSPLMLIGASHASIGDLVIPARYLKYLRYLSGLLVTTPVDYLLNYR